MRKLRLVGHVRAVPVLGLLAVLTITGASLVGSDSGSDSTRLQRQPQTQQMAVRSRLACPAAWLSLALGPRVVPYTGEHAVDVVVTDTGKGSCLLIGYPGLRIRAGRRLLPFTYQDGGGPYLWARTPQLLPLRPGGHAAFVLAQYRCDVGELATATAVDVWLPGVPDAKTLSLRGTSVFGLIALCRKFTPSGPPDPGNTVAISPLESGTYAY